MSGTKEITRESKDVFKALIFKAVKKKCISMESIVFRLPDYSYYGTQQPYN